MKNSTIELVDPELGATIKIVGRDYESNRQYNAKTRIHVWGIDNLPDLVVENVTLPEPKEIGEDPANDRAYARYNRLYGRKSCEVARHVLEKIALSSPQLTEQLPDLKLRFSRVAGCGCGCSPGIVANDVIRMGDHRVDIYITLLDPHEV
jgi:hypothetical protein